MYTYMYIANMLFSFIVYITFIDFALLCVLKFSHMLQYNTLNSTLMYYFEIRQAISQ